MDKKIEVFAIRSYKCPKYPIKEDIVRDPSLLRVMPRRWNAKPIVSSVLSFSMMSGLFAFATGCNNEDDSEKVQIPYSAQALFHTHKISGFFKQRLDHVFTFFVDIAI